MMGMRFRKKNGGGGLKFKRSLSIEWNVPQQISAIEELTDGSAEKAVLFGQSAESVVISGLEFKNFKSSKDISLEPTTGRRSPIVSGQLFAPPTYVSDSQILKTISSTGAWAPRLPKNEELLLKMKDLHPDCIYEIKLVFAGNGRLITSKQIKLSPSEVMIDMRESKFVMVTGTFIAPQEQLEIRICSLDDAPPFLNALILKNVGFAPKTTASFFSLS
jgi:hypothetical protein